MRPEPGEQVLFSGHPCWRAMVAFHVRGLLFAILAGVLAGIATSGPGGRVNAGWVALAVAAVFALGVLVGGLRRLGTTYLVTDRRLAVARGLFARDVHEARLDRVQGVACRQSWAQRLLRVGTVRFDTAAGDGYELCFDGVDAPRRLARAVDRTLAESERRSAPARDWPGVPAGARRGALL